MKSISKTIISLIVFSIAMGYMESAVVIYLRKIYYPNGFQFPLIPLDPEIGLVEILREAATIIMLFLIGVLSAKTASLRSAYFILCFAVWDLFYYIFLWLLIGWPESLFTWDILFLIPVPWVGPVITPCIVSLTMILLATAIVHFQQSGKNTKLKLKEWLLISAGSLVIIFSFIWDYLKYISSNQSPVIADALPEKQKMFTEILSYVPVDFNWPLFLIGEAIVISAIIMFVMRMKNESVDNISLKT